MFQNVSAQRARAEVARLEAESSKQESARVYRQAISFASNIEDSLAMSVEQYDFHNFDPQNLFHRQVIRMIIAVFI